MRIALVGPYPLDPTQVRGGVESSFRTLVLALAKLPDVEPHVLTFVPGLDEPARGSDEGVPIAYLEGTRRLANATLHLHERRVLARVLGELRPDVVHAQDDLRYGYVCLKAGGRVPVVVSIHGVTREEMGYATKLRARIQLRLAGDRLERYSVRNARFLVSPTRYAEHYFGSEIRGRIWDVGNPIADRFFAVDPAPIRGRILYAGAVIPRKRLLDLVEALPRIAASVPDVHLRVAGEEVDVAYSSRVGERIRELQLEDRVTMLGPVTPRGMLEEYRLVSVLALPSGQETSPMVVGEAMAAGLPVVATRVGGLAYLVEEGTTGHLVDAGDIASLSARIAEVLGNSERRAALAAAARARAERSFRARAVAERVRSVYMSACGAELPAVESIESAE